MTEDQDTALERRSLILQEVYEERKNQISKGYTLEHDLNSGMPHILHELWQRFYAAARADGINREVLIENAALIVAAIEVIDTKTQSKEKN